MTIEKDTALQSLFDSAPQAAPSETVVADITRRIDRQRRRTLLLWTLGGIVLLAIAWWLAGTAVALFEVTASLLPDSLIPIESTWLDSLLAPINSVTGVVGVVFLFGFWLFRKLRF